MGWSSSIVSTSPTSTWRTWRWFPISSLSTSHELRLPLRWIAILYGRIAADFALTSGVHSAQDVLKAMMAGANVAMMTSALLENGIGSLPDY